MADYFNFGSRRGGDSSLASTPGIYDRSNETLQPGNRAVRPGGSRETLRNPSSIRIRRLPSNYGPQTPRPQSQMSDEGVNVYDAAVPGRRRSLSAPQRHTSTLAPAPADDHVTRQRTADLPHMGTINEGQSLPHLQPLSPFFEAQETPRMGVRNPGEAPAVARIADGVPAMENAADAARKNRGLRRFMTSTGQSRGFGHGRPAEDEYDTDVVDLLDLIGLSLYFA